MNKYREITIPRPLVDKEDEHFILDYKWWMDDGYVKISVDGKAHLLHRLIMDAKSGEVWDHINGIRADNRKSNLRRVSRRLNQLNNQKVRGIRVTTSGKFQARAEGVNLGSFGTYEEAKRAREKYLRAEGCYGD